MKNERINPILRKLTRFCLLSAILAWVGFSPNISQVRALNVTVNTDTLTKLDLSWTINPIDTGGNPIPTFDIPVLVNWSVISATYTYHGGGTPSDVNISLRHIKAPHNGDAAMGNIANLDFSFLYTQTPGIGGVDNETVMHPAKGHSDVYNLAWGYANIAANGTLVVLLQGTHVPEFGSSFYNIFLLGLVVSAAAFKSRIRTLLA